MKKRKRFTTWGLPIALLTLVVTLTACVGNETDPDKNEETLHEKQEKVSLKMMKTDGLNPYAKEAKVNDKYSREISRLFGHNITYEWLASDNAVQLMPVRFASGELPDLIHTDSIDSSNHPNALENGIFLQLNDLIDEYGPNLKAKIPEELWNSERVNKEGKIYGVPVLGALKQTKVVFVRQDWLDKLNMKPPVTLDDYLAYFEAVKNTDLNGSGNTGDQVPFMVHENLGYYNTLFFGYFGVQPGAWNLVDGRVLPDVLDPKMKDAIRFWKMLYDKGYINKDLFIKKMPDKLNDIYSDKVGMWIHDVQNINDWWATTSFNNPNVKLNVLPGPVNMQGEYKLVPKSEGLNAVIVINAKSKHPKEAIQFLDWSLSDDEQKNRFFSFGIEGFNYKLVNGKVEYNPSAPENQGKGQNSFYQVMTHPLKDNRMSPELVELSPDKELLKKAIKVAEQGAYEAVSSHMPPLQALTKNPELGDRAGSLFLDMFAKVITGKEELDSAFNKFVTEWKRRGGDEAIKEANEWYGRTKK